MAIRQKPLSVRMNIDTLAALDAYAALINKPRNTLINVAISEWLHDVADKA